MKSFTRGEWLIAGAVVSFFGACIALGVCQEIAVAHRGSLRAELGQAWPYFAAIGGLGLVVSLQALRQRNPS